LAFLSEEGGTLSDDTYTEKLITEFAKKLVQLSHIDKERCFQFWVSSGAQGFVQNVFSSSRCSEDLENFGLRLIAECVCADGRICDEASGLALQYTRSSFKLLNSNFWAGS
jgi:hypothetical protein